ncbi:MAG: ATP-dependent zinc metalloprotease FtsH, partial [Eubacterium aggregans]
GRSRNYSEEVAAVIDKEIRNIVETAFNRACDILTEKKDKLVQISEELLRVNTITGDEFRAMYQTEEILEGVVDGSATFATPNPEV